jgi:hypothetical protein
MTYGFGILLWYGGSSQWYQHATTLISGYKTCRRPCSRVQLRDQWPPIYQRVLTSRCHLSKVVDIFEDNLRPSRLEKTHFFAPGVLPKGCRERIWHAPILFCYCLLPCSYRGHKSKCRRWCILVWSCITILSRVSGDLAAREDHLYDHQGHLAIVNLPSGACRVC